MIRYFSNVNVSGSPSDVHVRVQAGGIAFCGVYVRPVGPVPGYWYFPANDLARAIVRSLPVQS